MIAFARQHFGRKNLDFAAGDATRLAYREEFDLVVSFNALHWVLDQAAALSSIRGALRSGGRAFLELVPQAARRSIEDVLEATRQSPGWARYFTGYRTALPAPLARAICEPRGGQRPARRADRVGAQAMGLRSARGLRRLGAHHVRRVDPDDSRRRARTDSSATCSTRTRRSATTRAPASSSSTRWKWSCAAPDWPGSPGVLDCRAFSPPSGRIP
jgi:SAM-dependent methyltransferase